MFNRRPDPPPKNPSPRPADNRTNGGGKPAPPGKPAAPARSDASLRSKIQERLMTELERVDYMDRDAVQRKVEQLFNDVVAEENMVISRAEKSRLLGRISAEITGYGPLDALLADDSLTEIMVNGPDQIYIERGGKLYETNVTFEDDEHLMAVIERIVAPLGRRIDESQPMVDGRLPDGSRINAIIPPLSLVGPVLTIRKFARVPYTADDLINFGSFTPEMSEFFLACVESRLNIVVSGGTGAGKTTLLNVLSAYIPPDERIVTIENAAELQLRQKHVVTLEARLPNIEGKGEITIRQLVINALRMRPDRIIVGEARGGEALDMLQAMNTGHDGSLTTIHSNSPRDALARIETMVLMAGMDLPLRAIREQVASALDLVIHIDRMKDGGRKIVKVSEVQGMEGDIVLMSDVFVYDIKGVRDGKVQGAFRATGIRPKFVEKIEAHGLQLPARLFAPDSKGSARW